MSRSQGPLHSSSGDCQQLWDLRCFQEERAVELKFGLKDIKIHLVEESMSESCITKLEKIINDGLDEIKKFREELTQTEFHCKVDVESWNTQPSHHKTSLDDIAVFGIEKSFSIFSVHIEVGGPKVVAFHQKLPRLRGQQRAERRETPCNEDCCYRQRNNEYQSVNGQPVQNSTNSLASGLSAATDSGTGSKTTPKDGADEKKVDSSQGVSHRVVTGQSFLDENYTMGSWSFASDPHGN
ncbi:hypothetical protein V8E54_007729 [Elaphomyces granulatus]